MADIPHDWVKSTLGHGETMCLACGITEREAVVLGELLHCKVKAKEYAAAKAREPSNG